MASQIKRGETILIPFMNGASVYDSQLKPRMYKTRQAFERQFPNHLYPTSNLELVEFGEVRHGRWIHPKDHVVANEFFCSECNKRTASLRPINRQPNGALLADENGNFYYPPTMKYCPECGAKMDAEVE